MKKMSIDGFDLVDIWLIAREDNDKKAQLYNKKWHELCFFGGVSDFTCLIHCIDHYYGSLYQRQSNCRNNQGGCDTYLK